MIQLDVQCGARIYHQELVDSVTACKEISIIYRGVDPVNPITLKFQADCDDSDSAISYMEKAIKSSRHGRMISFRIIPEGSVVYYKNLAK